MNNYEDFKDFSLNLFSTTIETKFDQKTETGISIDNLSKNDVTTRIFYMAIKWAKTMPSFSSLDESDQVII